MINSGIYLITNLVNGHTYLGQSSDIRIRWNRHRTSLRKGKHHSRYLQRAWNKYGEESFKFEIIELVQNLSHLGSYEISYFNYLKPEYNICAPGDSPSLGIRRTPEFRQKMSDCRKGSKSPNFGKTMSPEVKEKIRQSLLGGKMTETMKSKLSKTKQGYIPYAAIASITKPVEQISLSGEVVKTWPSARAAVGFSYKCISSCCHNHSNTHKGFYWKFL